MTEQRALKVFLCHASVDKPAVRKLYRYLREHKIDSWLDAEKLLPGQNWQVEIPKALLSSDVIIICLSKNSVDREGYVQKEIKFAMDKALEMPEGGIFLIPALLEECDLPYSLSTYHPVNLFEDDGYKRLLRSLRMRAAQIGAAKVSVNQDIIPPDIEKAAREKAGRDAAEKVRPEIPEPPVDKLPLSQTLAQKKERENEPTRKFDFRKSGIISIISIALLFGFLGINYTINNWPVVVSPTSTSRPPTKTVTITQKPPTSTFTPAPSTSTITLTPPIFTPTLGIGSTMISEKDGMSLAFVPTGEFTMGRYTNINEQPVHKVVLDAFWIDQTEVTNKMYALCVQTSVCTPPSSTNSSTRPSYYENPEFEDYPVIYVDWYKAKTYCEWAGRRLPTEAEWEKAARGTDGRNYPWGKDAPNKMLLNYNGNVGDTTEIGKYPAGASIYGALDMAGNAWEWVSSLYKPYPYSATDGRENLSATGTRAARGGSWSGSYYYDDHGISRFAYRVGYNPSDAYFNLGFRCAFSE